MDILTTKLPPFGEIVINFLKNGKTAVLEQLRNLLEQLITNYAFQNQKN